MHQEHFGIVVGIDQYPGLVPRRDLTGARRDARDFYDWLTDEQLGGVPAANCTLIECPPIDDLTVDNARPILAEVKRALLDWEACADRIYQEDPENWDRSRLYLFVSGHGTAKDVMDAALLMANAGTHYLDQRLSCAEVLETFTKQGSRHSFRELVIFADCCRNDLGELPVASLGLGRLGHRRGTIRYNYFLATCYGEFAFENVDANAQRGYFTTALIEGLHGGAAPAGERITSKNLRVYLENRLESLTSHLSHDARQRPECIGAAWDLIFVEKSKGPKLYDVRLRVVNYTGRFRVYRGDQSLVDHLPQYEVSDRGRDVVLKSMPLGIYCVTPEGGDSSLLRNDGLFKVLPPAQEGASVHCEV
jgi:hypothetical protein